MKKGLLFFLLMAVVVLLSCEDDNDASPSGDFNLDEEFTIDADETLACICDTDFIVHFSEVVEDSRCPLNVVCVWEGLVTVRMQIDGIADGAVEMTLVNSMPTMRFDTLGNHVFELIEVKPVPIDEPVADFDDYMVNMRVSEL